MGTCIIWAIWTALPTIMPTSSCGLDTMTMPSTGSVWNTVSGVAGARGHVNEQEINVPRPPARTA